MGLQAAGTRYRFEGFDLDPAEHRFAGPEGEIHLRPKTLELLTYLVEHQGRLVTRQQLLDALWAGTGITENSLSQCVRELREALQDDSKEPRFIQTVQRVGYRFVAAVETRSAAAPAAVGSYEEEVEELRLLVAEEENGAPAAVEQLPARRVGRSVAWGLAGLALLGVVSLGAWWAARPSRLPLAPRDWLLIGDFDNPPGEPAFDAALRAQLEREISLSRVNVVPRGRVADTLALMKRAADTRVTEPVGREVCMRDGAIRALLTGGVQAVGGRYAIALKLLDPASGNTMAVFTEDASARDALLPAIHRIASQLRRRIGGGRPGTSAPDEALERVTTPSLEALTVYSKGLAQMDAFEWQKAEALFGQAVAADPNFALACFFLGVARTMGGLPAQKDLARARALAAGVTSRERALIEASTAASAAASIEQLEAYLQRYPDDYWGHEFVSWRYFAAGARSRWREHQVECSRLRPNFAQPRFHDGWVRLLVDGDAEKAQAQFARVLELNPRFSSFTVQAGRGLLAWMHGRMEEAASEFADVAARRIAWLTPAMQVSARAYLARFEAFRGKRAEALALLETNRGMPLPRPDSDIAARFAFERAFVYQQFGDEGEAERLLAAAAKERIGIGRVEALGWLGILQARRGARSLAAAAQKEIASETREPPPGFWSPKLPLDLERARRTLGLQIEGEILLSQGRSQEALARFQRVLDEAPSVNALFATEQSPRAWLAAAEASGGAHARLGNWKEAAAAYQGILDRKVLCIASDGAPGIWGSALQAQAEALERAGRPEEAARRRAEYVKLRPPR